MRDGYQRHPASHMGVYKATLVHWGLMEHTWLHTHTHIQAMLSMYKYVQTQEQYAISTALFQNTLNT